MTLQLGILGADGRMGIAVIQAITETKHVCLGAALTATGSPGLGKDAGDLSGLFKGGPEWL